MDTLIRLVTLNSKKVIKNIYEISENDIYDLGTAFFISTKGHFITAGHVISSHNRRTILGIYKNEIYEIEILRKEYNNCDKHKDRIRDYAFGRINISIENPLIISKNTDRVLWNKVEVIGFTKKLNNTPDKNKTEIEQYELHKIPGSITRIDYNAKKEICDGIEYGGYLENAFEVSYMKRLLDTPKGISGGPIINEANEVVGINIRGHELFCIGIILDDALVDLKTI